MRVQVFLVSLAVGVGVLAVAQSASAQSDEVATRDFFVPHVSTLRANEGQTVGLFVREKTLADATGDMSGRVVLFIHGGNSPSVSAYDFQFKDYSWMDYLAREGFAVYAMDLSGYGSSPRPYMDDPCNIEPEEQAELVGHALAEPCEANYKWQFRTIRDDWAEIDAVVEYLRDLKGVARVHLVGWSGAGLRFGSYAALNSEKVDRLFLYAPTPTSETTVPDEVAPGVPMTLQTREQLEQGRWAAQTQCEGQVDPELREPLWDSLMEWDRIGASWSDEGVMRTVTITTGGWSPELAAQVTRPTLVMVGELDTLAQRRRVYEQVASEQKLFIGVSCASHFMLWERQHTALHQASLEWLRDGEVSGVARGELWVRPDGSFSQAVGP